MTNDIAKCANRLCQISRGCRRYAGDGHSPSNEPRQNYGFFVPRYGGNGMLDMLKMFDVFRASESQILPRDMCEGCVCCPILFFDFIGIKLPDLKGGMGNG